MLVFHQRRRACTRPSLPSTGQLMIWPATMHARQISAAKHEPKSKKVLKR